MAMTLKAPVAIKGMFSSSSMHLPARAARAAPASAAPTVAISTNMRVKAADKKATKKATKGGKSGKAAPAKKSVFAFGKKASAPETKKAGKGVQQRGVQLNLGGSPENPLRLNLGFTKANELFVGRMAMLGFSASLIGEAVTGLGPIGQLASEIGLNASYADEILVGLAIFNVLAAFAPTKGEFVPDPEEKWQDAYRTPGALQDPTISMLTPKRFFGITDFGFTKQNELFVGRVAQLGFAASMIGEALTGQGALAQLGLETGLPVSEIEPLLLAFIGFFAFAALNPGSGKFVVVDEKAKKYLAK